MTARGPYGRTLTLPRPGIIGAQKPSAGIDPRCRLMNPVGVPDSRQAGKSHGWRSDREPVLLTDRTGSCLPRGGPKVHRQKGMVHERPATGKPDETAERGRKGPARLIEKGLPRGYS